MASFRREGHIHSQKGKTNFQRLHRVKDAVSSSKCNTQVLGVGVLPKNLLGYIKPKAFSWPPVQTAYFRNVLILRERAPYLKWWMGPVVENLFLLVWAIACGFKLIDEALEIMYKLGKAHNSRARLSHAVNGLGSDAAYIVNRAVDFFAGGRLLFGSGDQPRFFVPG